jgi:hypothetical protein
MEKAILQTLIYADIFDYPLKAWEIHKWLIKKKASLSEVEKGLRRLTRRAQILERDGYYVLKGRSSLFHRRLEKVSSSQQYLRDAVFICKIMKIIPWIRLIGISGNLAMENAGEKDDIDLFVITKKNRLWLSRFCILVILGLLERRRTKGVGKLQAAGKFCLNLLLEEDQLEQERKDLYIAHEVLQMRVLWERKSTYESFLLSNEWVFRFLPNWISVRPLGKVSKVKKEQSQSALFSNVEQILRFLQLRYMGMPTKQERVGQVAVYFHPEDMQPKVLKEFERRCKKYIK